MACYHQNVLFYKENGIIKKNGKPGIDVINIIYASLPGFKGYEYYIQANEEFKTSPDWKRRQYGYKLIPCGKCIGCRAQQRKDWAIRIDKESKLYQHNYFLTLTYNDENLPMKQVSLNEDTGRVYFNRGQWKGTLNKDHLRRFIHSLRNYFEREYEHTGLKFYACGEYGDTSDRPHYHIILMNCPNIDSELKPVGKNPKTGDAYYNSERIAKIWHKGFISIGKVNLDSINYVAGYCNKKLFGDIGKDIYASKGQEPIFSLMSRRPGIGRIYYDNNKNKIYDNDEIINSKGKSVKPPKYYDRLYEDENYDKMREIKKIRETIATDQTELKMSKTGLTIKEQMKVEEDTAKEKQQKYNRERIKSKILYVARTDDETK